MGNSTFERLGKSFFEFSSNAQTVRGWVPQLFVVASPRQADEKIRELPRPVNSRKVRCFEMPAQLIDCARYGWDANGFCGLQVTGRFLQAGLCCKSSLLLPPLDQRIKGAFQVVILAFWSYG